ncbi:uncharacterized protein CBL_03633 [Carabus blaptoides fortunei]
MSGKKLLSVDFEVFGVVQGVFFRKYTEKQSKLLGVKGWCMNTRHGTVKGTIQGEESAVQNMKQWLHSTGSPSSRIDKCKFSNEEEITSLSYKDFAIRR